MLLEKDALTDVAAVVDRLAHHGFPEEFRVVGGHLQVVRTGERLEAKDLVIRDYYRFEGVSDPDDMAIVYGVESATGARGTVVDAFGVYADPALASVLRDVPIRQPLKRAA